MTSQEQMHFLSLCLTFYRTPHIHACTVNALSQVLNQSCKMGLDLLLFCALAFASQGVHGFAHNNLVETVENLQKQLKLLSNVVDRLEADNDALKTRVKALEELQVGKAGEHDRAYNSLEVDAVDPEKIDMHVLSDLKSSKYRYENEPHKWSSYESQNMDKYSVDRKRIGKVKKLTQLFIVCFLDNVAPQYFKEYICIFNQLVLLSYMQSRYLMHICLTGANVLYINS